MKNKKFIVLTVFFLLGFTLNASQILFRGGYTRVNLKGSEKELELSDGAYAETDKISISTDLMRLYGEDYRYVDCSKNVKAVEKEHLTEIKATELFYDREDGTVLSNGWIEINDPENEALLQGAWFEFNLNTRIMLLQIQASIKQVTKKGLLSCKADSIEYNATEQTLSLRGNANISWGEDKYRATYITVNIETEEVSLHGSISGEIND